MKWIQCYSVVTTPTEAYVNKWQELPHLVQLSSNAHLDFRALYLPVAFQDNLSWSICNMIAWPATGPDEQPLSHTSATDSIAFRCLCFVVFSDCQRPVPWWLGLINLGQLLPVLGVAGLAVVTQSTRIAEGIPLSTWWHIWKVAHSKHLGFLEQKTVCHTIRVHSDTKHSQTVLNIAITGTNTIHKMIVAAVVAAAGNSHDRLCNHLAKVAMQYTGPLFRVAITKWFSQLVESLIAP